MRITGVEVGITVDPPVHTQIDFAADLGGAAAVAGAQDRAVGSVHGVLIALAPELTIFNRQSEMLDIGLIL